MTATELPGVLSGNLVDAVGGSSLGGLSNPRTSRDPGSIPGSSTSEGSGQGFLTWPFVSRHDGASVR
jgi:hypothetical protein